jgi:triacylglycerol esterase/lipase EstA (alpha/beta hydrolase family)
MALRSYRFVSITRRTLECAAIALTVVGFSALSAQAPAIAAAAPTPASDSLPVVIVHGYNKDANTDCAQIRKPFDDAMKEHGYRGKSVTFGFYRNDSNCDMKFDGTNDTPIAEVGRQLALAINKHFGGQRVNIIAHSMGGLITKAAAYGVGQQEQGRQIGPNPWPKVLDIADIVTLGTPHAGEPDFDCQGVNNNQQCKDMRPGSDVVNATRSEPQASIFNTDYTYIGSKGDTTVNFNSATNGGQGKHRVTYLDNISHTGLRTDRSRHPAQFTNDGDGANNLTTATVNGPVDHAIAAIKFHDRF